MDQNICGLVVAILMFLSITPLFALLIQASVDLHETSKRSKQIRKEIEDLIDRM